MAGENYPKAIGRVRNRKAAVNSFFNTFKECKEEMTNEMKVKLLTTDFMQTQ